MRHFPLFPAMVVINTLHNYFKNIIYYSVIFIIFKCVYFHLINKKNLQNLTFEGFKITKPLRELLSRL